MVKISEANVMEVAFNSKWPFITRVKSEQSKPGPTTQVRGDGFLPIYSHVYNGEKNLGEMGPAKNYAMNYRSLRVRSWQALVDSEIAQTVIKRYLTWVVGSGLKLSSEPMVDLLAEEGIKLDRQKFSKSVEMRFSIYRKSKKCDYSGMKNLDKLAALAFKTSIVSGDVLILLRYINDELNVQLIDGAHIEHEMGGTESYPYKLPNGNSIIHGIEVNDRKEHVAYWVRTGVFQKSERIPAKGENSGLTQAFLIIGSEHRIDNIRGVPLLGTVLETLSKMERYKEATLGNAEEIAKVAYQVVHGPNSDGSDPLAGQLALAHDADATSDQIPRDAAGQEIANKVGATTNKMSINMPIDSELKILNQSNGQINFKDFYTVNIDVVCACLGIPPNVAMSKYDSNFSASRANLKDWENTLRIVRESFADEYYQPIFNFWFDSQVLKNKISAPGYLMARNRDNTTVLDAYRNCSFKGTPVPHIDPLKEVKAIREQLGTAGEALPLITLEEAIKMLGGSDAVEVMEQFSEELQDSIGMKIVAPVKEKTKSSGTGAAA